MNQLQTAKNALLAEIASLAAQRTKLTAILSQLEGKPTVDTSTGKKRGRRSAAELAAAADAEVAKALEMIQSAGKAGIKAIALAHALRKAGGAKIGKIELLETGKIKMTGKGGGSTYTFTG